jgi:hypothetical protein
MDGFQCLHLNAFQRVRHLVQRGTVEPPEFLDPGCISAERIGFGAPETTGVGRLAVTCGKALTSPVDSSTIFRLAFLRRQ